MRSCAILALPSDGEVTEVNQNLFEKRARDLTTCLRQVFRRGMFYIFTDGSRAGHVIGNDIHLSTGDASERMELRYDQLTVPKEDHEGEVQIYLQKLELFQERNGLSRDGSVIIILAQPKVAEMLVRAIFRPLGGDRYVTTAFPPIENRPMVWGDARVVAHRGTSIDLVTVRTPGPDLVTSDDVLVSTRL